MAYISHVFQCVCQVLAAQSENRGRILPSLFFTWSFLGISFLKRSFVVLPERFLRVLRKPKLILSLLRRHLTEESGGEKKFGEMPAINRHKISHCAYRLGHANFDKLKLRGSRKGLRQGVKKFFVFNTMA